MKLIVDTAACREYANCVVESPEVFDLDDATGKVVALIVDPPAALHDDVRRAVASCPARALRIEEE
jgi:ferredoxin